LAGTIGIGGILLVPLLVFGAGMPIHAAAGVAIVGSLTNSLSAMVAHRREGRINVRLGLVAALGAVVAGAVGGWTSAFVSSKTLTAFYLVAVLAALALVAPVKVPAETAEPRGRLIALAIGTITGFVGGMTGVGGGFIQVPLLSRVARLRMHVAVGTSQFIVLFGTSAGFLGKLATAQVPFPETLIVVAGGMLGAQLGTRFSGRISARGLRGAFSILLVLTALRVAVDLFG
jgi:uncharacterized membrane protein YfcA